MIFRISFLVLVIRYLRFFKKVVRNRRIYYFFSLVFVLIATFFSCTEEVEEAVILTEDVLYLSGERVRLSGRIYSNGGKEISEHGFEISLSETYESPILIQNGIKSSLGAFIGESSQLIADEAYYYRAFAVINDVRYYGSSKSFLTLSASLASFSPRFAYSNDKVEIIGANFSSNVKVFFGENEAEILSVDLESIIEVRVPDIGSSTQVFIKVIDSTGEILFSEPFEYVFGEWNQIGEFPQDIRFFESISITKGRHFVFGLGRNHNGSAINNFIWDYDFNLDNWVQIPFSGSGVRGAFYNDAGYFGAGAIDWQFQTQPTLSREFWKYDNGSISYIGEVPFELYKAVSFYYQNNVFVTGGFNILGDENYTSFLYSELSDTWIALDDSPIITAEDLPNFTYNNFQYFITEAGEMWTFNLDSRSWNKVVDVPIFVRTGGISEVIGDKAYIGVYSNSRTIWEYDIINNTWKEKSRMTGDIKYKNAGAFVKDAYVRVIRLNTSSNVQERMQIWEFDPEAF